MEMNDECCPSYRVVKKWADGLKNLQDEPINKCLLCL